MTLVAKKEARTPSLASRAREFVLLAVLGVLGVMLATSLLARVAVAQQHEKLSPFQAIRWTGDEAEVRVRGAWYRLRTIDGHSTAELLAFCRKQYGGRALKRFEEDLVQVLTELGDAPGSAVDLGLLELAGQKKVELKGVEMTRANRDAILDAARARAAEAGTGAPSAPVERIAREHATTPDPAYADLARWPTLAAGPSIPRERAAADLDQLEWLLRERFSYRDLAGVDVPAALDAVRLGLPDEVDLFALALQVRKLLARFGDGHSRLERAPELPGATFLPCLVEDLGERFYAVKPDRSGFLDKGHPCLTALDGLPLERWLAASGALQAGGHAAAQRRWAVRGLRDLTGLRAELGLPVDARVRLTLSSEDGKKTRELVLDASRQRPLYGQRIEGTHRILAGKVGYLRLASMEGDEAFLAKLDEAMASFQKTKGLVIDVRGNGGGSRDALVRLAPYFLPRDQPCLVANVAAYRLAPGEARDAAEGYLADRFLFPRGSARHDEAARYAIDAMMPGFRPEWTPPEREFSAWHYLVLHGAANPAAYVYVQPVVVLLDVDCFSATDIFLAAFAELPSVTLLGQTSGGGSGRALGQRLVHSGLELRLSSMASFRIDGRRIDGRGIEPDVVLAPEPGDLIGQGDSVLDAAVARLR